MVEISTAAHIRSTFFPHHQTCPTFRSCRRLGSGCRWREDQTKSSPRCRTRNAPPKLAPRRRSLACVNTTIQGRYEACGDHVLSRGQLLTINVYRGFVVDALSRPSGPNPNPKAVIGAIGVNTMLRSVRL